jgi:phosphatidylglycerophosphate synthase
MILETKFNSDSPGLNNQGILPMRELRASGLKKHLPNIISCIRIIGAFALPLLMWKNWEKNFSLPFIDKTFFNVPIVWIIAYLVLLSTDKLDGTLARKLKAESGLGAALDSIGDVLVLVMGATLCFVRFVGDNLETWQFWLYVGMMVVTVLNKVLVFILAQIYHGKGNMVHTYFQKLFAASCYVGIFFWAFLRTIPEWSIYFMLAVNIYATIDESIYVVRTAEYNVDFKGHGFEKYKKRESITG